MRSVCVLSFRQRRRRRRTDSNSDVQLVARAGPGRDRGRGREGQDRRSLALFDFSKTELSPTPPAVHRSISGDLYCCLSTDLLIRVRSME